MIQKVRIDYDYGWCSKDKESSPNFDRNISWYMSIFKTEKNMEVGQIELTF